MKSKLIPHLHIWLFQLCSLHLKKPKTMQPFLFLQPVRSYALVYSALLDFSFPRSQVYICSYSVAIAPGAIPLTRIPLSATSKATVLVNIAIPPFDAA